MSAETKIFTALTIVVGVVVVAIVGYSISQQPFGSDIGTATIEVSGTPNTSFEGTVGTLDDQHHIEGTTPFSFETGYRQRENVLAALQLTEGGRLEASIRVDKRNVDIDRTDGVGGRVALLWKAQRRERT